VLIVAIFFAGYVAIVLEQTLRLNKSAAALITGVLCWTAHIIAGADPASVNEELVHQLGEVSQVVFFLLTAMTIVEIIDAHDGFEVFTSRIRTTNRRALLVAISALAFFLSAVLDNLTTAIVMMSLVRRLARDAQDRMYYAGVIVIAANAGGAWSPIGDVTTTMLWVGHQITTTRIITRLVIPSLVSVAVPVLYLVFRLKGNVGGVATGALSHMERRDSVPPSDASGVPSLVSVTLPEDAEAIGKTLANLNLRARIGASVATITRDGHTSTPSPLDPLRAGDVLTLVGAPEEIDRAVQLLAAGTAPKVTTRLERGVVLAVGLGVLLFVPVFKQLTHLPPIMGILLGLGVLWVVTELIHKRKAEDRKGALTVSGALQRIDAQSVLFFLGILLAIGALESGGILAALARKMEATIGNADLITLSIGLASSIVDNVPLVAAVQAMYPLSLLETDHRFWIFLAYCAGTGGSILIIGSAAGVAVMGIEHVSFGWYLRRLSFPALLGYVAGALAYLALAGPP
jgi:Na+/H+ antiporter NhaD/arsenite permease-like protein